MYDSLVLIGPNSAIDLQEIRRDIDRIYSRDPDMAPGILVEPSALRLAWEGFGLNIYLNDSSHVAKESQEIAERFAAGLSERRQIAASTRRFEITADEDPDMDYFNDYALILEAIERLGTVFIFDPMEGKFVNI